MRVISTLFLSATILVADYKPSDNLVTDGIPAVPDALAAKLRRYNESRSATLFDWHPTNREMLIGTRFGQTVQVHHLAMPGGARTQLTFFPEKISGAKYHKSGKYFVFSRDIGGNERYQNYRFDLGSGESTLLTDGKSRNSLGIWNHAGNAMAYTSTRKNGTTSDLYTIDPQEPMSDKFICELGAGWAVLDWSPDDKTVLVSEYVSINESYLWLVTLADGKKTLITPKGKGKVSYSGGKFAKDGLSIWTTSDRGSEFRQLVTMDIANGVETVQIPDRPADVEDFDLSPDHTMVACVINMNGVGKIICLHVTEKKIATIGWADSFGSVTGISWRPHLPELAIEMTSASAPNDVFTVFLDNKAKQDKQTLERWTTSETGGIVTTHYQEPELVVWKSFDERHISGFLYSPPKKFAGKRPVILNIHGGPEGQSRPKYLGAINYYPQELGVAVLFPNVRGSSGFGKTFLQLDNGFKREDSYKDIAALFDWIKTRPDLDADRIMVTGGSYGGHMTLALATHYSDRIRCAVDIVGISNLRTFLENTEPYRRDLRRAEYGDERDPKMREFMERTAPLNNVQKATKPMFIIQGLNDPRVPASEAEQMVRALKARGTPVWYLLAKDEGHGFAKQANREYQDAATALFVEKYLLDGLSR